MWEPEMAQKRTDMPHTAALSQIFYCVFVEEVYHLPRSFSVGAKTFLVWLSSLCGYVGVLLGGAYFCTRLCFNEGRFDPETLRSVTPVLAAKGLVGLYKIWWIDRPASVRRDGDFNLQFLCQQLSSSWLSPDEEGLARFSLRNLGRGEAGACCNSRWFCSCQAWWWTLQVLANTEEQTREADSLIWFHLRWGRRNVLLATRCVN